MKSFSCGGVWTGSGSRTLSASRITISDGRIAGIEATPDMGSDLFVIPSFVDAHFHFLWTGLEQLYVDLRPAGSGSDLLGIIEAEAADFRTGNILRAAGFDESLWKDQHLPSLEELDSVTGDRPMFARRVCCHKALVNTAMMRMLPEDCTGIDPSTGIICEGIVLGFEQHFQPDLDFLTSACDKATAAAFAGGITAGTSFETVFFAEAIAQSSPRLELAVYLFDEDIDNLDRILSSSCNRLPEIAGLKFFLDGSLGAATAAVNGTYIDGSTAELIMTDEQVLDCFRLSRKHGLRSAFHAIGAKALTQIDRVSGYPEVRGEKGFPPGIRIEHAEELMPAWPGNWDPSVHEFCMQPNFVENWQRTGGLYENRIGRERAVSLNPFGIVRDSGFSLGFGSDGMPIGPLKGLNGATRHTDPRMSLDIDSALYAYTIGAAELCGFRELSRHLAKGRQADITILSHDPFLVPWNEITVTAVLQRGKLVHGQIDLQEVL